MWLHVADIWAKKRPKKSGQFLYEQTGSKERANARSNSRSWWVATDISVIEFAGTDRDVHKFKHPPRTFGRGCVLVVDGGKQACPCCTTLSTPSLCASQSGFPQPPVMPFYYSLANNCHVQVFVGNYWIRHHCWRTCLGKWLLSMLCPLLLCRETCLWLSEHSKSIIHRPGKTSTATCCWFGISCPTDWIIQIIVFLQRQKTQLIRGSSSVCPSFSMETARTLLGLLQAAHLGPTFYIL